MKGGIAPIVGHLKADIGCLLKTGLQTMDGSSSANTVTIVLIL